MMKQSTRKDQRALIRYLLGYLSGILVFIILIPFGIFSVSSLKVGLFAVPVPLPDAVRDILSVVLISIGVVFVTWSNFFLFLKGRGGPTDAFGITLSPQTQKLVISGAYEFSRNPMVFGVFCAYLAIALFLNSLGGCLTVLVLLFLVLAYIKLIEEKRLLRDFGEEYVQYRRSTPMFFPYPKQKPKNELQ